jgi:hypothetical protein
MAFILSFLIFFFIFVPFMLIKLVYILRDKPRR